MELKSYQRAVINDLRAFLDQLSDGVSIKTAFRRHWLAKGAGGMPPYRDVLEGVPNVCLKVPTGGGKTYLAAHALEPIFAWANPRAGIRPRMVVWLAPSRTILKQTLRDLKNPSHHYRKAVAQAFGNRLAVMDKDEVMAGASFSPDAIRDQVTILVLSYDSLKSRTKDNRKLHEANGRLMDCMSLPGIDIGDKESPSVADVLRAVAPVLVVDESHNATTPLSRDMLADLAPSFILDLTATPREDANVISFADAMALKSEGMVKLPVILRNRRDKDTVYRDAIDLQATLEREAVQAEQTKQQRYIRPIVLFLAESRTGQDDRETYEKVRSTLISLKAPADQIAIKTGDIDEIGDADLLSRDCPIRFIITVNALKEGWDCSFAYILASLADRSSAIDVQQVLGRILRQPGARPHISPRLNMSYVLTASERFGRTVSAIIDGLKGAGFSERDYRIAGPVQPPDATDETPANSRYAGDLIDQAEADPADDDAETPDWLDQAADAGETYARAVDLAVKEGAQPREVEAVMNRKPMLADVRDLATQLTLPQFYLRTPPIGFLPDAGREQLLDRTNLLEKFSLKTADADVRFDALSDDARELDIEATSEGSRPFIKVIDKAREREIGELLRSRPRESQLRQLTGWLRKLMERMPPLSDPDIRAYVARLLDAQPPEGVEACIANPRLCAKHIQRKIMELGTAYAFKEFNRLIGSRDVFPQAAWRFPPSIAPTKLAAPYDRRLYEDEAEVNGLELTVMEKISPLDNVAFWHRNLSRGHGFRINGPINHYPDFIVIMKSGMTVVVEAKGDDRDNTDSKDKLALGRRWADLAGRQYAYFMVFDQKEMDGAMRMDEFVRTIRDM